MKSYKRIMKSYERVMREWVVVYDTPPGVAVEKTKPNIYNTYKILAFENVVP